MSDETDVRPGVGGAVRYGYVILTTYHTYLDLSSITDTGYFGYYSITHTIVCVILAKKQYHISIHGYYNVHGTPGLCWKRRERELTSALLVLPPRGAERFADL